MLDLQLVETAILRALEVSHTDETRLLLSLRREFSPEIAAHAVLQIRLRRTAQRKFSRAASMWFTPDGLEQSSSQVAAQYHASRFPQGAPVVDGGCGIGGDLIALAARGRAVGVERHALSLQFARRNLDAYAVRDSAELVHGDLLRLRLERAPFLFLDPARRSGRKRFLPPEQWSPDWRTVCQLAKEVRGALVKAAPALAVEHIPDGCEREYVSVEGECRELLLAFGECRQGVACSVLILPEQARLTASGAPVPGVRPPMQWVYDPDPAVVAARLVPELAQKLNANLLHPQIAYLTSEQLTPTPFARAYRVLEYFPYSRKALFVRLRALGAGTIVVKKRGVAQTPEDLVRAWKPAGQRKVVVLLYRAARGVNAVLAEDAGFVNS